MPASKQLQLLRDNGLKLCVRCSQVKALNDFSTNGRGYHRSECKECNALGRRKERKEKPNTVRQRDRNRYHRNKSSGDSRFLIQRKLSNSRTLAKNGNYLPCLSTVDELVNQFTTKCQVCNAECGTEIYLDHCHKTGKFRGFLCSKCNFAIGLTGDSPDRLVSLAEYLISSKPTPLTWIA